MVHASQQIETPQAPSTADDHEREVGFARLTVRSLPQLILFNGVISFSVAVLLSLMGQLAQLLLTSKGTAFTTANITDVLFSWQGALILVISFAVVAFYIAFDLFAHVFFCEGLLEGEDGKAFARALRAMKRAVGALPRFFSLSGLPTLIYIALLAPLVGAGFSIGLTRDFYVPSFIMSVIRETPVYFIAYCALVLILFVVGVFHFFTVFGVLLDNLKPSEARRVSRHIVRSNARSILKDLFKGLPTIILPIFAVVVVFAVVLIALSSAGSLMPADQEGVFGMIVQNLDPTEGATTVTVYHFLCFFANLTALAITYLVVLVFGSCTMMFATHLYKWHSTEQEETPRYPLPMRKRHRSLAVISTLIALSALAIISFFTCMSFEIGALHHEPVAIVAHRMGGNAAPENSLEGLEYAIENGCYGAETDIQRTSDGRYVINHDDTFARLSGVKATSQDLTFADVEQLSIRDPNFPDKTVKVPTLEEALDVSKGHIKLFIELKGKTADRQMVDDVVRIIREHDAVDGVVLISLRYDCISYAKETYPEFECGLLFFAEYGNVSLLKCDILLAEEETATNDFIYEAHKADREVGVWTANEEDVLRKVLNSEADYVITDKVALATSVQEELDNRSDFQFIFEFVWGDVF